MRAQNPCVASGPVATVTALRNAGYDLAVSLGRCPPSVQSLTLEWHLLDATDAPLPCRIHRPGDGDAGGLEDERDPTGDGRHRCGLLDLNSPAGTGFMRNLRFDRNYRFTIHAVLASDPVIADFILFLPAGARANQLALVNLLAVNAPTVDVNTCRCLCPGKFCTDPICPPEAKLLSTIYPPATMGPGDVANASLTFANCSGNTVPTTWRQADGYRLKARPAVDATLWTTSAVELLHPCAFGPCFEEVPPCTANFCYAHTFDFSVTAPMVAGSPAAPNPYDFTWGVVEETAAATRLLDKPAANRLFVAKEPVPRSIFLCGPPPCPKPPCQLNPGPEINVDPTGNLPASSAIQECIARTPIGGTLELPLGIYLMDKQVVINHPMTLRTAGIPKGNTDGCWTPYPSITKCAVLQAKPELPDPTGTVPPLAFRGFFQVFQEVAFDRPTNAIDNVHIDHLILDGNRRARVYGIRPFGATEKQCLAAPTQSIPNPSHFGWNGRIRCTNCSVQYSASLNSVCNGSLPIGCNPCDDKDLSMGACSYLRLKGETHLCKDNLIQGNVFSNNGDHNTLNMWSDGSGYGGDGGTFTGNYSVDNSDVDLIFSGYLFSKKYPITISNNTVLHSRQGSFAGLMLAHFDQPTDFGNYTGDLVTGNTIDCGGQQCDFGIALGSRPWGSCAGPAVEAFRCISAPLVRSSLYDAAVVGATTLPNLDTCSYNIYGGTVTGNRVLNAKQGINVDGAGAAPSPATQSCPKATPGNPITVYGNLVSGSAVPTAPFQCAFPPVSSPANDRATSDVNISDFYNFVDRRGETAPITRNTYCPASSGICPSVTPGLPDSKSYFCP